MLECSPSGKTVFFRKNPRFHLSDLSPAPKSLAPKSRLVHPRNLTRIHQDLPPVSPAETRHFSHPGADRTVFVDGVPYVGRLDASGKGTVCDGKSAAFERSNQD